MKKYISTVLCLLALLTVGTVAAIMAAVVLKKKED